MAKFIMLKSPNGSEVAVNPDLVRQIVRHQEHSSRLSFDRDDGVIVEGSVPEVAQRLSEG
jgi:hypothetical protein